MTKPRILLADDHKMFSEMLANYLKERCELSQVVKDGSALLKSLQQDTIDVVIADLSMPGIGGLECLRKMRAGGDRTRVIILTMHRELELACEALRLGANGYILKNSAAEELLTAIAEVMDGRIYLSKEIASDVMSMLAAPGPHKFQKLTPRQMDVLKLVAVGRTMKEVAAALQISVRTAESYKYESMQVLGVSTTAELIQYAITHDNAGPIEPRV